MKKGFALLALISCLLVVPVVAQQTSIIAKPKIGGSLQSFRVGPTTMYWGRTTYNSDRAFVLQVQSKWPSVGAFSTSAFDIINQQTQNAGTSGAVYAMTATADLMATGGTVTNAYGAQFGIVRRSNTTIATQMIGVVGAAQMVTGSGTVPKGIGVEGLASNVVNGATMTNAFSVDAEAPIAASGGVITNAVALIAKPPTTGTNNSAIVIGTAAPTGTWALYSSSTNASNINGPLTLGGTGGPTFSWGATAPADPCVNGSVYSRTDATGGIYQCKGAVWVAL